MTHKMNELERSSFEEQDDDKDWTSSIKTTFAEILDNRRTDCRSRPRQFHMNRREHIIYSPNTDLLFYLRCFMKSCIAREISNPSNPNQSRRCVSGGLGGSRRDDDGS